MTRTTMVRIPIAALVALAIAVPAAAAPPSNELARLKHQAALLKAKVQRLTAANTRLKGRNNVLSSDSRTLDQRWNEALARERALERHILGIDPCPITRPNNASAPPLRSSIPDGYGDAGFQATRIIFPSDGCWQVTGSVGNASLTFVTLVVGAPPPS